MWAQGFSEVGESVVVDPAQMNHSGVKNDDGFPGIRHRYLLCPIAFLLVY